tara:strand:+ start:423 stop:767 length:345 start_codon:yes stop_codon:yes gene_type:complete
MPLILFLAFAVVTIWLTMSLKTMPLIGAGLIGLNLITAVAFTYDKLVAGRGLTRVPERVLLCLCFLGGLVGGGLSMMVLRHKTSKRPFRQAMIAILIIQLLGGCGVLAIRGHFS